MRNFDAVEDAVQSALATALLAWAADGPPEDPGAWLYRVSYNNLIGALRKSGGQKRILDRYGDGLSAGHEDSEAPRYEGEIRDDLLRMLFICCDEGIPPDSRLVLALKVLCGFGAAEIARRLFTTEANVHKRFARARDRLREIPPELDSLSFPSMPARLPSVRMALYLLFNEGYLSAQPDQAIRVDLCEDAIRLAALLSTHPLGASPETHALLALMYLHSARLPSRTDGVGGLLLLEEQDRTLWDRERIRLGLEWLQKSGTGEAYSRFHAEAAIAAEHCLAPSFAVTRWEAIVELYARLEKLAPSPLNALNRAVALAEWKGPKAGLALLQGVDPPVWLTRFHLWDAVLGELYRRAGEPEEARRHLERALEAAPTDAERGLLRRRLTDGGMRSNASSASSMLDLMKLGVEQERAARKPDN